MLRLCWRYLRPSRIEGPPLGPCWARLGPSWAYLGPMLGLCWPMLLALCWPYGPMLALSWPMLALPWPYVGPILAYVGPMLAHLGAYVEAMLAICETISVERPPRCQFFLPGRLHGTKNHVKTTFFYFRQPKNCDRPSAQNTVKNDVFVTSRTHETPCGDFGRSG